MNITHEILDVLAKETEGLCLSDLFGTLKAPKNNAHVWRNRVTQSLRTLSQLDFIVLWSVDFRTHYQLLPRGRQWLKDKAGWDKMAAQAAKIWEHHVRP